jgi:hypothetical protein
MSRLNSLTGASFRPAQPSQPSSSSAAEKLLGKLLDGGKERGRIHRDGFDPLPKREPHLPKWKPEVKEDRGLYQCVSRLPSPNAPKEDPGLYQCVARLPSPNAPKEDPGLYQCVSRVPSKVLEGLLKDLKK